MKKNAYFIFVLIFIFIGSVFADTIPISRLHENNSNGEPVLLGQTVTVSGEVTVANEFGISSYVQDETGGVAIYDQAFAGAVTVGDFVTVSGVVEQYKGLTELKNVAIIDHVPGPATVVPEVVTCSMVANEGANGVETLEGKLIRINNVTVDTDAWTISGSGTNYVLTDATGSCEIRIDKDCAIANTNAPSGTFDVIGVVSQYDPSAPYTEGYQVMPRFPDDIVFLSGPQIIKGPNEVEIEPYSLEIFWQTDVPANSILMYGLTDAFEIDTLIFSENLLSHSVALTGLNPATLYHIRVGSADATGTNYSGRLLAMTASDPSSTGEINVYFNSSVDHSLAIPGNEALGNQDIIQKFIDRVNAAQFSIDVCFYSWDLSNVTNAIIDAKNRGVKIRFINDSDHAYQTQITRLRSAGIEVIDQSFSDLGSWGIQHNKFAIFDARDNSSAADDWVWTGSANFTAYTELGVNAMQNVLEIQDQSLAKAYTIEFEEMWGSDTDTPNSANSRFGANKTDNLPHHFNIGGRHVELYMCPSDRATSQIIEEIENADRELYFCILAFTRYDIEGAMHQRVLDIPNFYLRGVFDSNQDEGSQYYTLKGVGEYGWSPPADVLLDAEYGVLHHKYMIIDANYPDYDPVVITGSQNWSTSAETKNDENTLIIHDAEIANLYLQEFAARYHAAGGSSQLTDIREKKSADAPRSFRLEQNYPNPFNSQTTVQFQIPNSGETKLIIYNLRGEVVKSFELGNLSSGDYRIIWDAKNEQNHPVSGGVYFYSIQWNGIVKKNYAKKMIYLP